MKSVPLGYEINLGGSTTESDPLCRGDAEFSGRVQRGVVIAKRTRLHKVVHRVDAVLGHINIV